MPPVEEPDFYESFDILWDVGKYDHAIRLYEYLGRPFWLADKIGLYFEHKHQPDRAMFEYEHMINAYFAMGKDFLPIPGGPIELYKLGKYFMKTEPAKAHKYLTLYVKANERNSGEIRKAIFKKEAKQLLEELMLDHAKDIDQCLKELEQCGNVLSLKREKVMPNILSLTMQPDTRRALWWYRPETNVMEYSKDARTHFQLEHFPAIKDVRGWVRGAVLENDGLCYILIYQCDFPDGIIQGKTIVSIYRLAEAFNRGEIFGFVDEQGYDLLRTA